MIEEMPSRRLVGPGRATATRLTGVAIVALVLLVAPACGTSEEGAPTQPASGTRTAAFPRTVSHAFGDSVILHEPRRVVAWGWGSADAAVALGVVPVAIPFQAYGGDNEGVLPWIRERLKAENAALPIVLPDAEEPPFEAIAAARPDLILAVYSGITGEDYKLLSAIAPTVAYPGKPWATPWRDTVKIVGSALGRDQQAAEVLRGIDDQVAAKASAHPELKGKSVAMVWDSAGTFYVYKPADARVEFTLGLGLVNAPSVTALASGESSFFYTLSYEQLEKLTSDILVSYADTPEASEAFLSSPHGQLMEQVRTGRVAPVIGKEFIASVSPPTALSLTWGLDEYVRILATAAKAAGGPR
ncbi:MAG: iron-siderophore ABC transporter substrate-binding protein [Actinomycetota bacterium]